MKKDGDVKDDFRKGVLMKKEKFLRIKLVEIFEYIFFEFSESLVDEIVFFGVGNNVKKLIIVLTLKEL